jgi:hypothetical protein
MYKKPESLHRRRRSLFAIRKANAADPRDLLATFFSELGGGKIPEPDEAGLQSCRVRSSHLIVARSSSRGGAASTPQAVAISCRGRDTTPHLGSNVARISSSRPSGRSHAPAGLRLEIAKHYLPPHSVVPTSGWAAAESPLGGTPRLESCTAEGNAEARSVASCPPMKRLSASAAMFGKTPQGLLERSPRPTDDPVLGPPKRL